MANVPIPTPTPATQPPPEAPAPAPAAPAPLPTSVPRCDYQDVRIAVLEEEKAQNALIASRSQLTIAEYEYNQRLRNRAAAMAQVSATYSMVPGDKLEPQPDGSANIVRLPRPPESA